MLTVRDWQEQDTDWWVGLRRRWDPTKSDTQLRVLAAGRIGRFIARRVALDDGRPVGMGFVLEPVLPGTATSVIVEPLARGRGVGSMLWADIVATAGQEPLLTFVPDRDEHAVAVGQRWGFSTVTRAIASRLDLSGPLPEPHLPVGMRIKVISGADPEADAKGLDGLIADTGDFPGAQEMGWAANHMAFSRLFSDITWVLVLDGDTVASAASLSAYAGPGGSEWAVVFTGTRPAYRGRGLSRAAKQALHQLAARRGATGVVTMNDAANSGIRALNASMGYRPVGGELRMMRPGR